jgi:hypothetical protein
MTGMSAVTPSAMIVQMKKKAPLDLAISPPTPSCVGVNGKTTERSCGESWITWLSFYPSIRCKRISGRIALWRNSQNLHSAEERPSFVRVTEWAPFAVIFDGGKKYESKRDPS